MTQYDSDLVYGRMPVLNALQANRDANKLYVQKDLRHDKIQEISQKAQAKKVQVSPVPKSKLDQMTDGQNHQGVVLSVATMPYASIDDLFDVAIERGEEPFFLILDEIEDPHNLGSIIRTADAAGAHGIIIPKHRSVGLTSTVAKTSTGAIEYVKVARVTNLVDTMKELKDRGLWLFGSDMEGEDFREWNSSGPIGVVIGNEGKGLSRLVKENCDGLVTIPMAGHVQSLNASVAAALMMYEVARDRLAKL